MFKKIIAYSLLSLIIISLLTGCSGGSYLLLFGGIDKSDTQLSGDYAKFDGHYYVKRDFEKGDKIEFSFKKQSEQGSIKAELINADEDIIEEIRNGSTIVINKTQNYKIKVIGEDHKGEFTLKWTVNHQ